MSTASDLYDMDDDNVALKLADHASILIEQKTIQGVDYITYNFRDGSKLTFGSNGYMGMEEKA